MSHTALSGVSDHVSLQSPSSQLNKDLYEVYLRLVFLSFLKEHNCVAL